MNRSAVAADIMRRSPVTAREGDTAARVVDLFQELHIHSVPVVDSSGSLVGMVSQEDILIGSMSLAEPVAGADAGLAATIVRDIMTSPAIHATEETPIGDLCRMMWRFRIHHVPIVRSRQQLKLTGIVSSLDICRVVSEDSDRSD